MELVRSLFSENEWAFRDPMLTQDVESRFNEALEAYDEGLLKEAEALTKSVLVECPNHIDALHHIGLFRGELGDTLGSYVFCQAAVAIGLQAIPSSFRWDGDDLIRWSELANRPFLRAYHALGVHRMEQDAWHDAITIFTRLLTVNPNDNQGVRYILPKCWFETNNEAAIIEHCRLWAGDTGPDILYSKALALSIAKRTDEAQAALQECVAARPLVAQELLRDKHVEPERRFPGMITLGGADEAWEYWREYGRYWCRSKLAMALLQQATETEGA